MKPIQDLLISTLKLLLDEQTGAIETALQGLMGIRDENDPDRQPLVEEITDRSRMVATLRFLLNELSRKDKP